VVLFVGRVFLPLSLSVCLSPFSRRDNTEQREMPGSGARRRRRQKRPDPPPAENQTGEAAAAAAAAALATEQEQRKQHKILQVPRDDIQLTHRNRLLALTQSAPSEDQLRDEIILGAGTPASQLLLRNTALNSLSGDVKGEPDAPHISGAAADNASSRNPNLDAVLASRMSEIEEREATQLRGLFIARLHQLLFEAHFREAQAAGGSTNPFAALDPTTDGAEESEAVSLTSAPASDANLETKPPSRPVAEPEAVLEKSDPESDETHSASPASDDDSSSDAPPPRAESPEASPPASDKREREESLPNDSDEDEFEDAAPPTKRRRVHWGPLSYFRIRE
jgi:hypothetical protein